MQTNLKRLILGSASAARFELINGIGFKPDLVISPNINEDIKKNEHPKLYAMRLAKEKNISIISNTNFSKEIRNGHAIVLTADTVVTRRRKLIDKALCDEDVRNAMNALSGGNHSVYSAFMISEVIDEKVIRSVTKISETRVKFKNLSKQDIDNAVASKSGIGMAGGYKLISIAGSFIISLNGSVSNVIGFSTYDVRNSLLSFGLIPKF